MTPPAARLVTLYLGSRQTRTALALLAGSAAVLRASQPVTKDAGVFPDLTLMLLTLAGAAVIAAATRNPFGEAEHTASSPLSALRLIHLLIVTGAATAAVATAGWTASYAASAPVLVRNLAGFTGIALLTAVFLGAHLAWTVPLGYVMYCGAELDAQTCRLWTWPTLPAGNHAASALAVGLLAAGIAAGTIIGSRDRPGASRGRPRSSRQHSVRRAP
jgi:hypothetical protein